MPDRDPVQRTGTPRPHRNRHNRPGTAAVQNRHIRRRISLAQRRFIPPEPAVDGHAMLRRDQLEVHTRCHPDLVVRDRRFQSPAHRGFGRFPVAPVLSIVTVRPHPDHRGRRARPRGTVRFVSANVDRGALGPGLAVELCSALGRGIVAGVDAGALGLQMEVARQSIGKQRVRRDVPIRSARVVDPRPVIGAVAEDAVARQNPDGIGVSAEQARRVPRHHRVGQRQHRRAVGVQRATVRANVANQRAVHQRSRARAKVAPELKRPANLRRHVPEEHRARKRAHPIHDIAAAALLLRHVRLKPAPGYRQATAENGRTATLGPGAIRPENRAHDLRAGRIRPQPAALAPAGIPLDPAP